jgi:hypothetical protein
MYSTWEGFAVVQRQTVCLQCNAVGIISLHTAHTSMGTTQLETADITAAYKTLSAYMCIAFILLGFILNCLSR